MRRIRQAIVLLLALQAWSKAGALPPAAGVRRGRLEPPPALLFPLGLHIGTTGGSERVLGPRNFTVGGELSAVYFDWLRWSWLGGFVSADALYQSAGKKIAFGPELGFWPFGFDAGPVWLDAPGARGWGVQGRFHLTAVVSSLYVGVAALGPRATVSDS
jgi:hypothetical protein